MTLSTISYIRDIPFNKMSDRGTEWRMLKKIIIHILLTKHYPNPTTNLFESTYSENVLLI